MKLKKEILFVLVLILALESVYSFQVPFTNFEEQPRVFKEQYSEGSRFWVSPYGDYIRTDPDVIISPPIAPSSALSTMMEQKAPMTIVAGTHTIDYDGNTFLMKGGADPPRIVRDADFTIMESDYFRTGGVILGTDPDGFPIKVEVMVDSVPGEFPTIESGRVTYPKVESQESGDVILKYKSGVTAQIPPTNPVQGQMLEIAPQPTPIAPFPWSQTPFFVNPLDTLSLLQAGDVSIYSGPFGGAQGEIRLLDGNLEVRKNNLMITTLEGAREFIPGLNAERYSTFGEPVSASAAFLIGKNPEGFDSVVAVTMERMEDGTFSINAKTLVTFSQAFQPDEGGIVTIFASGTTMSEPPGSYSSDVVGLTKSLTQSGVSGGFVHIDGQQLIVNNGNLFIADQDGKTINLDGARINVISSDSMAIVDQSKFHTETLSQQQTQPDSVITRVAQITGQLTVSTGSFEATGTDSQGREFTVAFRVNSKLGVPSIEILEIIEGNPQEPLIPKPSDFNPFSVFFKPPVVYSQTAKESRKFCGDGILTIPEECEGPNSKDNNYCANLPPKMCLNKKTAVRDNFGSCNAECTCEYDAPAGISCVKDSCGAACSADADCASGQKCDQSSCSCVTSSFCGDGIVQTPNSQGFNEECDSNQSEIIGGTNYCKQVKKCIGCKLQTIVDKTDAGEETCDGIDNDCNDKVDDYIIATCRNEQGLCAKQLGVCKGTQKVCNGANGFQDCAIKNYNSTGAYQETETLCDNLDNDCDGNIDEGCDCVPESTKACGYNNLGICKTGTQTCNLNGKWEECFGAIHPQSYSETACDSIDNDCDGLADECVTNACGECGEVPKEVCNYRDDNCNAESGSPTKATFNQQEKFYFDFLDYCLPGTTCKGTYADGTDNNNNNILDEGIDEGVKEKADGDYKSWCSACQTQPRRCQEYQEDKFKKFHEDYYFNYKTALKNATESQIVQNLSGDFYFACRQDSTDVACCLESQCVYNGKCYDKGYRQDIDNDGVIEICFSQSPGIWIEYGDNFCENDCTFFDDSIVHAFCDGKNGCSFYDSISKEACDNSQPGWARDYNSTHYVTCAPGVPQPKVEIQASVSCESRTLVKVTRIVVYNGKPVQLVVAVCG